jgi:2,3-bisphosphoglycerate-independent phosphoglycerate mutase
MADNNTKKVMLLILDGWGIREFEHGNAVAQATTPNFDHWLKTRERSIVEASGEAVGLTPDQMGNSEVGHLNLGAGRIVYQDITAINMAIKNATLGQNEVLGEAIGKAKTSGGRVHLVGLVSDGGVHSHVDHLYALLDITKAAGVEALIHVITDGRDTPPNSGLAVVARLEGALAEGKHGRIASISGRYYSMDRDNRWERTRRGYDAIFHHSAPVVTSAVAAVQAAYEAGVTDEFIEPAVVGESTLTAVKPGDTVVFYNFRADRMRQLVQACALPQVNGFDGVRVEGVNYVSFTEYMDGLPVGVVFGKERLKNTLAEVISAAGLSQYHSAETEKYPHVTFFFNGRTETPFPGEDRRIIPSPKVATYDLQPEMSAPELTEATLERMTSHDDSFILVNFANPDMVGHTGVLSAAVKAVETVDACAARLVEAWVAKRGVAIVTADHGNCERMVEELTGAAHTYHTTNPVSLFVIGQDYYKQRPSGILADVAPTVLDLLGVAQPAEMTGRSLIERV